MRELIPALLFPNTCRSLHCLFHTTDSPSIRIDLIFEQITTLVTKKQFEEVKRVAHVHYCWTMIVVASSRDINVITQIAYNNFVFSNEKCNRQDFFGSSFVFLLWFLFF
jgi:hypothetical protein